jgi:hypothetical protein
VIGASVALLAIVGAWKLASYPPVIPRVPLVAKVQPAPAVPANAVRVQNLFLVPQLGAPVLACQKMADGLGFAVPCPELLPSDAIISDPRCCISINPRVPPLFVLEFHFRSPAGYPGAELSNDGIPRGHLVIIGQRRSAASAALACEATIPDGDGPTIDGSPSYWQRCPGPGANAGHLILEWEVGGISYSVSLHGYTEENRAAIELIAEEIQLVDAAG